MYWVRSRAAAPGPDNVLALPRSPSAPRRLRIYDVPQDVHMAEPLAGGLDGLSASSPDTLQAALRMQAGETVYDFAWYPRMSGLDASTCCFVSTSRDHPLHMWDACTGEVRCSYRGYNDVDEPTAAYSAAFSPDGARLAAGYNKAMYVFDVTRPGRDYKRINTHKRKHAESLPGTCLPTLPTCPPGHLGTCSPPVPPPVWRDESMTQ